MKKLGYVIAAIGAIAVAAPSIASAETVVVKHRAYHQDWNRARAEMRMHRDHDRYASFRHHDHDRVVIPEHRD